ncbi:MAG: hypothetical protein LAT84_13165 [Balneolia bacterium]|nr:hypothetical protein [Balneolia bacterium]
MRKILCLNLITYAGAEKVSSQRFDCPDFLEDWDTAPAVQFDTQPEQTAEALISILEPLLIVILGIIIELVLIASYLPLFDLEWVTGV